MLLPPVIWPSAAGEHKRFLAVKSLSEIEAAIAQLPSDQQRQLIRDMPALCPTVFPASGWDAILQDESPRPALTSLLDSLDAEYVQSRERFTTLNEDSLRDPK